MESSGRRGPRGDGNLKEAILSAAANRFRLDGYQKASVRAIAADAGVSPKLIYYYFGTKNELFSQTIGSLFHASRVSQILEKPPQGGATAYVKRIIDVLDDPYEGAAFVSVIRSLGTHEESRDVLMNVIFTQIIPHIAPHLPGPDPMLRTTLAGTQMLGLVMARYIVKVPHIVDMSAEDLAPIIGAALENYLYQPLPGA